MSSHFVFFWTVLVAVFALCGFWFARENRRMKERWQEKFGTELARDLAQFALRRTVQLLFILGTALLILGIYDGRLQNAQQALDTLNANTAAQNAQMESLQKARDEANAQQAQMKTELEKAQKVASSQKIYYPPAQAGAPGATSALDDLYNPEDSGNGKQAGLDRLKKHYEEILVNNMFMNKCGMAKPTDIHIIISALSQEMASINAPGRLQYDILTSARGSYNEMYAKSPCDAPQTAALAAQYAKYIDSISGRLNAPAAP